MERAALERLLPTVDGVVLAGTRMSDSAIRMIAKQKPVIVLNRAVVDVPSVVTDNARGARLAVEHLAGLGHESLAYAAGPEASWADGKRWQSLRDAAARPATCGSAGWARSPPTVAGGLRAADALTGSRATAVVAYNDQMAIGLVRGLTAPRTSRARRTSASSASTTSTRPDSSRPA